MGNLSVLENIIDKKLNSVHTAFLAKVITFKGDTADITVLQKNSLIIPNVPVCRHARNKTDNEQLATGDIVLVVCCESNISTALKGEIPTSGEPIEHFALSNSIIVGIL